MKKCLVFISLLIIAIPFYCNAATEGKCDYAVRSEVRKLANNVTVSYDIVEDGRSKYIDVAIYNISDEISIYYSTKNMITGQIQDGSYIYKYNTTDGVYHIKHEDVSYVYKYTFEIRMKDPGKCESKIRTVSLTVPKYNTYSELDDCQYTYTKDYVYCQKWITNASKMNDATIKDRIKKYKESMEKTTTTTFAHTTTPEEDNYERLMKLRTYTIIGLSIGIAVDLVVIVFLAIRLKEYKKYDI